MGWVYGYWFGSVCVRGVLLYAWSFSRGGIEGVCVVEGCIISPGCSVVGGCRYGGYLTRGALCAGA